MLFVVKYHEYQSSVHYDNSAGNYNGYVNPGKDTAAPGKDAVTKEALVFMLVSF